MALVGMGGFGCMHTCCSSGRHLFDICVEASDAETDITDAKTLDVESLADVPDAVHLPLGGLEVGRLPH